MMGNGPTRFVILGGGTAGWMAAACLSRILLRNPDSPFSIQLVESEEIGIVGVGEASIPSILDMLRFLNIDEADFIRHTDATFKLAIQFQDWKVIGDAYWHPFGTLGPSIESVPLFHYRWRALKEGRKCPPLQSLSICSQMAALNRFSRPEPDANSVLSGLSYAYHFDTTKVGPYLRTYAEGHGVRRHEGRVSSLTQSEDGDIQALILDNGHTISADFFIDCSGFQGLLIEKTLGSAYSDWSHWLPCDRAVALPTERAEVTPPYTLATARDAGWTWRIPLQSRTGNGYVYASSFIDEAAAQTALLDYVDTQALSEPRHLRFKPGARQEPWQKNCLSLGLASGFLEPLESTNIHFVYSSLTRFLDQFPTGSDYNAASQAYNRASVREVEESRDFIIAHYYLSKRKDTAFWRYVTTMDIPDSLRVRIDRFQKEGHIGVTHEDLFKPSSWVSIFDGLGLGPEVIPPLVMAVPSDFSNKVLETVTQQIGMAANRARSHDSWLPSR